MTATDVRERELYELGPRMLAAARFPDLPEEDLRHLVRGMWDHAGFIGRNNSGYPVASLIAPAPVAHGIAALIHRITGRRSVARPLNGSYWVGISGRRCSPWLAYLYDDTSIASSHKLHQARVLIGELS